MEILAALFVLGIVLLIVSLLVFAITVIIIATYNAWKESELRNDIVERRRKRHEQYEEQEND